MLSFFGCDNNVVVRSLLLLPGKVEKQWWMELLENVKKWMYKLLRLFLVLSFGGIASGGKSGLPQVLEWEIKLMLGVRDYLQLPRGFIRKKEFSQGFCHPLRACRETHSVATQRLEEHSLQCGLHPCWALCSPQMGLSPWALSLPQWSHFLTCWVLPKLKPW